jgi:hypothetical protein
VANSNTNGGFCFHGIGNTVNTCSIQTNNPNGLFANYQGGLNTNIDLTNQATEESGRSALGKYGVIRSESHNAPNGYAAWSGGGIIRAVDDVVPPGATFSYKMMPTNAANPTYTEFDFTVAPNQTIALNVQLRKDTAGSPRWELVDAEGLDYFYDGVTPALSEFICPADLDTWHAGSLAWVNTASREKRVKLRLIHTASSGNVWATFAKSAVLADFTDLAPELVLDGTEWKYNSATNNRIGTLEVGSPAIPGTWTVGGIAVPIVTTMDGTDLVLGVDSSVPEPVQITIDNLIALLQP